MKSEIKLAIIFIFIFFLFYLFPVESKSEEISSSYFPWLQDRCAIHGVPMEIAIAVGIVESNFKMVESKPNSNGSIDIGIFQLNSDFLEWFEEALWYEEKDFDAYDPYDNIEMGIIYLRHLFNQTRSWDLAVRSYNTGLHALSYDPDRSLAYLVKVINVLNTLEVR